MSTDMKATTDHIHTTSIQTLDQQMRSAAKQVGRFLLHFLEMLVAMMVGMPILFMLGKRVPTSSSFAPAFTYGTILFVLNMTIFMTVTMVAWMIMRGHGWRHSAEMAFGMAAPVVVMVILRLLVTDTYLPWFMRVTHLAMLFGMLVMMLYRRDHYTGKAGHAAHAAH